MLRVGEDNVQMSKFIKNELGLQTFENGRAFYEFNREEDLNYYKEVVKVQKDQVQDKYHSLSLLTITSHRLYCMVTFTLISM